MATHKMLSPNTRIDWIPAAGLTAPSAPSIAQLNAGSNLSAAIQSGYTLKMSDSSTDNSKTIVDEGNVETPTLRNYEGKLSFYRDEIGTGTQDVPVPATVFTTALDLFKVKYVSGWLVSRHGKKATVAYAVGDRVSVYKFKNDVYRELEGDAGETPVVIEVEFLKDGAAYPNVTCVV